MSPTELAAKVKEIDTDLAELQSCGFYEERIALDCRLALREMIGEWPCNDGESRVCQIEILAALPPLEKP